MESRLEVRTGQPTASAGDTFRVIMDMGKFHGVIAAVTLHHDHRRHSG